MIRLLGVLLMVAFVWLLLRRLCDRAARLRRTQASPPRFEKTVRCARCGAHMPPALARVAGAGYVCRAHDRDRGENDRRDRESP